MQIGILSDTHGRLRPETAECLRGVDCILHAGDFDDPAVMHTLENIAPLYGVRGNNDWGGWANSLPRTLRTELDGVSFCIAHRKTDIPWNLSGVDVVVYGHTHQFAQENVLGRLWLNPGSCSFPRPYRSVPTLVLLTTNGEGGFAWEKVELLP